MLITGYIDESADSKVFTLSCLLATPMDWRWIESKWKAVLREKNKQLRKAGRPEIPRYHATDCANCKKHFCGWTEDEQIELTKKLIAILKSHDVSSMAFSMPLKDFSEVYECAQPALYMHGFLLKCIMHQLIYDIHKAAQGRPLRPFNIALVHERCDSDADIVKAFNQVIADESFDGREHFATIIPRGWEKCIALQAADMLAYENFRDTKCVLAGNTRRLSLCSLLQGKRFGGHSIRFNRKALEEMKDKCGLLSPQISV